MKPKIQMILRVTAVLTATAMATLSASAAELLHNWTFDADLTDAAGGKDATAFGDAGFQTDTSKIGAGAATFDGADDYMEAGTFSDFVIGTGTMSVSFWFNVADEDKAISDRFLGTGAGLNDQEGWAFFMRDNAAGTIGDGVDAGMSDGGGRRIQGTNANDTIDSLDGNWHLLVGVFDHNGGNGTVSIYLDSVLESMIALADLGTWNGSSITNDFPLTFGKNPDGFANFLDGNLDDVAIWDAALSQGEIDGLWNGGAGAAAASISGATSQLVITAITYNPDTESNGTVTLTWRKTGAATYIAKVSTDLGDWETDINDSLSADNDEDPDDAEHITVTLPLPPGPDYAGEAFFRIEEG